MADQDTNTLKRKHDDDLLDDQNEKNLELEQSYITMVDVLKEEEKLEADAYAVLGGSDDKNCTYEMGYVNRQALYSCRTCMGDKASEENGDIFGICLACSYACHPNHDLFELYTKRQFRCDCGTSKMKNGNCTLNQKDKDSFNEKNRYNHNFLGKYCLCNEPYPDPDGKDEEMAQCIMCEDWFHPNCLGDEFPDDENYAEMICKNCMQNNKFLWYYQNERIKIKNEIKKLIADKVETNEIKNENIKIEDNTTNDKNEDVKNVEIKGDAVETNGCDKTLNNKNIEDEKVSVEQTVKVEEIESENGHKDDKKNSKTDLDVDEVKSHQCKLKELKGKFNIEQNKGTTFWDEDWRSQLCKCEECLDLYKRNKIEFLIDETDTVHHYEAKGKEQCQKVSQYEQGLNEISKMDHVVGIEAIMEYNNMSAEFKEYFKKFAEDKKVIEQKDIEEFFSTLKYKKKLKSNHSF